MIRLARRLPSHDAALRHPRIDCPPLAEFEAKPQTGSAALSGLVVMEGEKSAADMSCDRFSELNLASWYDAPPADTEECFAMSVD